MTVRLGFEVACPRCDHEDAMKLQYEGRGGRYYLICTYCNQMIPCDKTIGGTRKWLKKKYPELIGKQYVYKWEQRDGYRALARHIKENS